MQQVGLQGQRAGDADALALAAGEAVRIALQVAARSSPTSDISSFTSSLRSAEVADAVDHQRLAQDVVDRHARVERAEGVLEDELDVAAERGQRVALQSQHVDAVCRGR